LIKTSTRTQITSRIIPFFIVLVLPLFHHFHYSNIPTPGYSIGGLNLRSLSALETTVTDEKAMAPAAKDRIKKNSKKGKRIPLPRDEDRVISKRPEEVLLNMRMVALLKAMR